MFLHIGNNVIVDEEKIIVIVNMQGIKKKNNEELFNLQNRMNKKARSIVLLSNGEKHLSEIKSATLAHRAENQTLDNRLQTKKK